MLSARTLNFQLSKMLSARTLKGPSFAALTQNALSRSVWSAGECVAASAGAAGASARRAIRGLLTCMSTGLLAPTYSAATGRRPTACGTSTGCSSSVTRPQGFRLRSDAEQMFQKKTIGIPVAEECRSSRDTKGASHGGVSPKRTLVAVGTRRRLRTEKGPLGYRTTSASTLSRRTRSSRTSVEPLARTWLAGTASSRRPMGGTTALVGTSSKCGGQGTSISCSPPSTPL